MTFDLFVQSHVHVTVLEDRPVYEIRITLGSVVVELACVFTDSEDQCSLCGGVWVRLATVSVCVGVCVIEC